MAMIDYGAIAFKNGKLISTDMFTPMIDMVGWEDTEKDMCFNYYSKRDEPLKLNGNYFAYIGDSYYMIAFYKTYMRMVDNIGNIIYSDTECFGSTNYTWSKWKKWFGGSYIKVTKRNGYFVCKWKYEGNKYKVYFGHGVDLDYYKKYHIVNYYRSPKYILKYGLPRWVENKVYDIKYGK